MFEPLVSIIVPVYNGANYMREAIDSALNQTYKNIEILVINDGSTDEGKTEKIALSYGDKIKYFNKKNGGVSSALNYGIKEMQGDYFSWLSHDDVYCPEKIEKQVQALSRLENKKTIIYCDYIHIDQYSIEMHNHRSKKFFIDGKIYCSEVVLEGLLKGATFNGCCLLIHRELLISAGLFDEKLRFCQDALMWYELFLNKNYLYCVSEQLVKNRMHSQQLTQRGQDLFRKECNSICKCLLSTFREISTRDKNYLRLYLLLDSKYLELQNIKYGIRLGETKGLISNVTILQCGILYIYGKLRPFIRRMYYALTKKAR